jgi:hypothetical protein
MARKPNSYRVNHKNLHRVTPNAEGCGDQVGPPLHIETMPPNASEIKYINEHFVSLCSDQRMDYKDESRCPYWFDYSEDMMLFGRYKFVVKWNSGGSVYRDYDLDRLSFGKDGAYHLRISQ